MKKIIIISKNPVKIDCARNAFQLVFPSEKFDYEGVSVPSGVSDQPKRDKEIFSGATNRIKNAKDQYEADFCAGIEGGIDQMGEDMRSFAWIVENKSGKVSTSKTADFKLPNKVAELIREGLELGDADDKVFGDTNSKQKNGSVGILTNNNLDRQKFYGHAMI